jgi:hypothetical protein
MGSQQHWQAKLEAKLESGDRNADRTVRWEKRPKQMRYFYHSLERFDMMETLESFDLVLLFQIVMERMRSDR